MNASGGEQVHGNSTVRRLLAKLTDVWGSCGEPYEASRENRRKLQSRAGREEGKCVLTKAGSHGHGRSWITFTRVVPSLGSYYQPFWQKQMYQVYRTGTVHVLVSATWYRFFAVYCFCYITAYQSAALSQPSDSFFIFCDHNSSLCVITWLPISCGWMNANQRMLVC